MDTSKHLEKLLAEKAEVAKQIADLDAKGEKGEALDKLTTRHKELTEQIESLPNADEMNTPTPKAE